MSILGSLARRWLLLMSIALVANVHAAEERLAPNVDEGGTITLPNDFRYTMIHLGSWYVPSGDASGFHDVYADDQAVSSYRETGKFPDGSIIVKELRAASVGNYTTGDGVAYANDGLKQWFVMVKDSKDRFSDNNSWGDGWGWALFNTVDKTKNISNNYKVDCLGCHVPAKNNDWIYTEAYPTLVSP